MKKVLLLTTIISFVSISAFSQIDKGGFLVGGNVSFTSYKNRSETFSNKSTTYQLQSNVGYFIMDKLAGGIRVGYQRNNIVNSTYTNKYNDYSLAPFVRYYFLSKNEKFNLFADASYKKTWTKYDYFYDTQKSNGYSIAAGPVLFLNPHVALEFTIGYAYDKVEEQLKEHTIETGIGLQIHLGKEKAK